MKKINLLRKKIDTQDEKQEIDVVYHEYYHKDFCPVKEFEKVFDIEEEN